MHVGRRNVQQKMVAQKLDTNSEYYHRFGNAAPHAAPNMNLEYNKLLQCKQTEFCPFNQKHLENYYKLVVHPIHATLDMILEM